MERMINPYKNAQTRLGLQFRHDLIKRRAWAGERQRFEPLKAAMLTVRS